MSKCSVRGAPLAGWMIHLVHTTHVSPTNEGYQTHPPQQGLPTKQSLGLIWMFDFNVSQPHLCLKMIICHWGKQTSKHWAFLGRVCDSMSCDFGCLPTVAREHSYSAFYGRYFLALSFSTTLQAIILCICLVSTS